MKATIINDIEDLENVDIFFVVGYPNFLYADKLSPMTLDESIEQFISSLSSSDSRYGPHRRIDNLANVMAQSVSYNEDASFGADSGYDTIKGLSGTSEEDLFLYNKKNINLKKGERAYYHIFSAKVDYKHIYKWEIPITTKVDSRGYFRSNQDNKTREQIWHSIKLNNSTKYPWTTAPSFIVKGTKPIAQDVIKYTPKKAKTDLKLTVALDIKTDRHETEVERDRNVKLYSRKYDMVTVKGKLYIKNLKNKKITMEIKKELSGEVLETSYKGKIKKSAEGLKSVNYNSIITWEIPLKKAEEKIITYKYKIYVSN